MEADPKALPWTEAYKLPIGSVVPRPIAWVSSLSPEGIRNVAPFSFFNGVCAVPMIVTFAPMRFGSGNKKDSLANIESSGEFVINIVTEPLIEAMAATSEEYPSDVDEFVVAGLTAAPSVAVRAPRIAESPINFECKLRQVLHFGDTAGSGSLVVGEVVYLHVADRLIADGRVEPKLLQPVARMGGPLYARPELLDFKRRPSSLER